MLQTGRITMSHVTGLQICSILKSSFKILALSLCLGIFQTTFLPDPSQESKQKSGSFRSQIYFKSCLIMPGRKVPLYRLDEYHLHSALDALVVLYHPQILLSRQLLKAKGRLPR